MSTDFSEHDAAPSASNVQLHSKSFKLRFASKRELGRSYVSAVKPLRLPAVVSAKSYAREAGGGAGGGAGGVAGGEAAGGEGGEERARRRVADMFRRGPRERLPAPLTSSQQYGWWWDKEKSIEEPTRGDRRFQHHIRDSAWLKERLRVLATDAGFKRC